MHRLANNAALAWVVIGLLVLATGCTIPHYTRTVTRTYDANGNLTGTQVEEKVEQMDPNSKPLLPAIKEQTYKK
jgi:hypothetical protein